MVIFKKVIEVRWSDIDANQHVTHTAYATFATHTRMEWMNSVGCSMTKLIDLGFSGVLLKDQTEYIREVFLSEKVSVELFLVGESADRSKWKFLHKIYKENQKLAAIYTAYGAWINISTRKIATPPNELLNVLVGNVTRSDDLEILL